MAAGRPKKAEIELRSIEDCTTAMGSLLTAVTEIEKVVAARDQRVAAVSAEYEPQIDEWRGKKANLEAAVQAYYMAHIEELEKDGRRSYELMNGVMGRRMTPPALRPLNRSWTWGVIVVKLRERFGARFLRTREPEIDKDLVKAEIAVEELKALGLRLVQDEVFYAEPARMPGGHG